MPDGIQVVIYERAMHGILILDGNSELYALVRSKHVAHVRRNRGITIRGFIYQVII